MVETLERRIDQYSTSARYYATPHGHRVDDGVGSIELRVANVPQCLIDIVIHSFDEELHDVRHFAAAPLEELLSDENHINRIFAILDEYPDPDGCSDPGFYCLERLSHALVPLCQKYPHRTIPTVQRLANLFDLKNKHWYFRARVLMSIMRQLEYCPRWFVFTVEKLVLNEDWAISVAAEHTLLCAGAVGREALMRLEGQTRPSHRKGIVELGKSDPQFENEDRQDIMARMARAAGWDVRTHGCNRLEQFEMAEFGKHAWKHLLPIYEFAPKPQEVLAVPRALAIIGHLEELIELYATSSKRKIAILLAIAISATEAKYNFAQTCKRCSTFKSLEDVAGVFDWTLSMLRDSDPEVAYEAARTLDILLSHPSSTPEHRNAAVATIGDAIGMSDPNLQSSRIMVAGALLEFTREKNRRPLFSVFHAIVYSLTLRLRIRLAIEGRESFHVYELRCKTKRSASHVRPQDMERTLKLLAISNKNGELNNFEAQLYRDLLAIYTLSSERERRAYESVQAQVLS